LRDQCLATSLIDLSDGLSTDLRHICEESGVSAEVAAEMIPRADGAALKHALHGGEDYELLFTVPRDRTIPQRIAGVAVTRIGKIGGGRTRVLLLEGFGVENFLLEDGNTSRISGDAPDKVAWRSTRQAAPK